MAEVFTSQIIGEVAQNPDGGPVTSQIIGEVAQNPDGGPVTSQIIGEVAFSQGEPEEETLPPISLTTGQVMGQYYVWLTDEEGTNLALFDDWRSLTINKNLNAPDAIKMVLDGSDSRTDLFELDGQLRVYRRNPFNDVGDYIEAEGFVRGTMEQVFKNNNEQFTVYGRGWEDLLTRRIVAYNAGTVKASKSDAAETVMKEYVKENVGSLATLANGRLRNGNISELSIATDLGTGVTWSGSRAYKNLLETLVEISNTTGIDFRVSRTGDKAWEFDCGIIGADRTATDIIASAGTNGAGNTPVIFSQEIGTIEEMSYRLARIDEANVVYALGKGEASLRNVVTRENANASGDSTMNTREISRNGSSQEYDYQLRNFADKWLEDLGPNEEFKFSPRQTASLYYGRDYVLGDSVTAKFGNITRHKRIVGVDITVTKNKIEEIGLTFQDVVLQ